jgi:hypothetical protein
MVELGDVLEVIHDSHRRFRTARLVGRSGQDRWQLWWAGDRRYRVEAQTPAGRSVTVADAPEW